MIGMCNFFCVGAPPTGSAMMTASQAQQVAFLQNTCWLYYCCCFGYGCTSKFDSPMCMGRDKCFCISAERSTTDFVGPRGFCLSAAKCACLSSYQTCPTHITPGCGLCNFLVATNFPQTRNVPAAQMRMMA